MVEWLFFLHMHYSNTFLINKIDSKESIPPTYVAWGGIFKLSWIPGNDSKKSIPPAYVACRAGTITLFLLGS